MKGCFRRLIYKLTFLSILIIVCNLLTALMVSAETPSRIKIGIITDNSGSQYRNASAVSLSFKGKYQLIDLSAFPGQDLIGTAEEGETWQVNYLPGGLQINRDGQTVKITTGAVAFREDSPATSNLVSLNNYTMSNTVTNINRWYRRNMEISNSGQSVVAVNELPLEEYLYGVVPREMSNSWPLEALKAQAAAARTYSVTNFRKHLTEGFNLLDTPNDQAYGGFNSEGSNATRAVNETAGQIISYEGVPISAVYHATSGGHTEDNENVWTGPPSPYLRGKEDIFSTQDKLANWTYTTTVNDVLDKINSMGGYLDFIVSIELDKYASGRVKTVIIKDINGNRVEKSGSEFGKLFNPRFYTYNSSTSFMSNFFDVKLDNISSPSYTVLNGAGQTVTTSGTDLFVTSEEGQVGTLKNDSNEFFVVGESGVTSYNKSASGSVVFTGHGWGHGVGMSQWGAYYMAKQGEDYKSIIKFYYSGVQIEG